MSLFFFFFFFSVAPSGLSKLFGTMTVLVGNTLLVDRVGPFTTVTGRDPVDPDLSPSTDTSLSFSTVPLGSSSIPLIIDALFIPTPRRSSASTPSPPLPPLLLVPSSLGVIIKAVATRYDVASTLFWVASSGGRSRNAAAARLMAYSDE